MKDNAGPIGKARQDSLNALFSCLANRDRRRLLGIVCDRAPDSLTRRDIATSLVSSRHENPQVQDLNEEFEQTFISLHHTHVPKLEASGLIEQDSGKGTVTITDHPAFEDTGVIDVIHTEENQDAGSLDALFEILATSRRRIILDVLSHQYHQIHTKTLASGVGANELGISESEVPAETIDEIQASLLHVHLPMLSEAGLIEYDADEQIVSYEGHSELRVPWMQSVLEPDFRASLTGKGTVQEVGAIEGRQNIVSYGQFLCDEANEELFFMFTATGLLEAGCLSRVRDAANRGVDIYLGTCDSAVQEFVHENVPEVVLWEPEADWLNLPVEEEKVGRLVFADRNAVLLGTLGEKNEEGVHEEKAIIGEGAENTLVTMMRQMLSSRLDRINEQTEDAESLLPF